MGDFAVIFEGSQIGYTLPTQTWFISSKFFPWGSPSFSSPWLSRVFSLQEWLSECCCFWVYSLWSSCRFRLSPRHSNLATRGKNTSIQVTDPVLMSCMYRYTLETVHFPVLPDISGYSHCKCDWVNAARFGCTAYWVAVDFGCFSKAFKSCDMRPWGPVPEYRSLI
jgi:hypothetical protein